jgi:signal transduction histidine kinase
MAAPNLTSEAAPLVLQNQGRFLDRPFWASIYLTLVGVTIAGVISIPGILDRWEAAGLLVILGILFSRYPTVEAKPGYPRVALLLTAQAIIATVLMQFPRSETSFALLFFMLSAISGLYSTIRVSLAWIGVFTLITGVSQARLSGWEFALRYSVLYLAGNLFFGLIANAFSRLQTAQIGNARLLVELNAKNRQLEEYSDQVETLTVIEERNRIAREMHDTIGHRLTIAAVQLEGAHRLLRDDPERTAQMLRTVREQVREALHELRQTVSRLRQPVEMELTLPQALRRLSTSFQEASQLDIHLDLPDEMCTVDTDQHLVLYRMAQEALTNVQRHAQAKQVWIRLSCDESNLQLQVQDDGRGFTEDQLTEGFGIQGLRERVRQIGGVLSISTLPGQGTTVTLTLQSRDQREGLDE